MLGVKKTPESDATPSHGKRNLGARTQVTRKVPHASNCPTLFSILTYQSTEL